MRHSRLRVYRDRSCHIRTALRSANCARSSSFSSLCPSSGGSVWARASIARAQAAAASSTCASSGFRRTHRGSRRPRTAHATYRLDRDRSLTTSSRQSLSKTDMDLSREIANCKIVSMAAAAVGDRPYADGQPQDLPCTLCAPRGLRLGCASAPSSSSPNSSATFSFAACSARRPAGVAR